MTPQQPQQPTAGVVSQMTTMEKDIMAIKQALYLLLKEKADRELWKAKNVEKESYDGMGMTVTDYVEDPARVKKVKEKYDPVLRALRIK